MPSPPGAIFLILCGLCPKLGAVVSIMPQSVLGGAAVMMFSSIVISGIQLITKEPLTPRSLSIVSVALGVGYGMGANTRRSGSCATGCPADFRWLRYRACRYGCHFAEHPAAKRNCCKIKKRSSFHRCSNNSTRSSGRSTSCNSYPIPNVYRA